MQESQSRIAEIMKALLNKRQRSILAYRIATKARPAGWTHSLDAASLEKELSRWYRAETGEKMDFARPRGFAQKMQWLKVHDRDPRKTELSDKLAVRQTIEAVAGDDVLPKVFGAWEKASEIDFQGLPSRFLLKCNNGSGMMKFIEDSTSADLVAIKNEAAAWLTCDFASRYFEMQYADIKPQVYAEEWLNDIEWEYQAWCFSGNVEFIAAIHDPHGINEKQFFSAEWEKLPFVSSQPEYRGTVVRPECLDKIVEYSERLSEGFAFVRVDWYGTAHGLMFSEMSFTPAFGIVHWDPSDYDLKVGELIRLPIED